MFLESLTQYPASQKTMNLVERYSGSYMSDHVLLNLLNKLT